MRGAVVKLCQVCRLGSSPGVKHLASLVVFWVVLYFLSVISYVKRMYMTLLQAFEVWQVWKIANFCDSLQTGLTLFAYKLIYF